MKALPKKITIQIDESEAKALSNAISDILCWVHGYISARPDNEHNPFNYQKLNRMNEIIKEQLTEF